MHIRHSHNPKNMGEYTVFKIRADILSHCNNFDLKTSLKTVIKEYLCVGRNCCNSLKKRCHKL